jgi:uncharacterized membrane protein
MEFFIAIIIFILIAILFNKISQLKKMIEYQDFKIKYLQEQLNKDADNVVEKVEELKTAEVVQNFKIDEVEKIAEEIQKPQLEISNEREETILKKEEEVNSIYTNNTSKFDEFIENSIAFIKDNFLTIFGIVTLVLGIAYFVKYAIDQNWINETFRVMIGVGVGIAIIGIAHKIRKNFEIFSSILIGGGLSVLYFTFTIAFREYHLFSQNTTFILLTIVTVSTIVLAFIYNRQVLAIFSIIGGFCAPLMISNGESNYVFLFGYLTLLNLGMVYMYWRKNWDVVSYIAFGFTLLYSFAWLDDSKSQAQFLYFILLYIIFTVTSLINYFKKDEFTISNCLLLVFNTILSTILITTAHNLMYIENHGYVAIIFGLINGLFGFYIYKTSQNKLLLNTLIGLCVSLITAGIALEFDANIVSICIAIESSLLLFLWKKSGENIFKVFFIVMFPFLLISMATNWFGYFDTENHLPIIFNHVFSSSFIVIVCSIVNIYLMKDFETNEQFLGYKITHSKFIFVLTSIILMYAGILFELIYQIEPYFSISFITSYIFVYTLFFIAILLFARTKLKLGRTIQFVLIIGATICLFLLPLVANIPNEKDHVNFKIGSYFLYLTYLIPTIYIFYIVLKHSNYKISRQFQLISMLLLAYIISFEAYNMFMLATIDIQKNNFSHQEDIFTMILLPIIWAILGFGMMYYGLKKQLKSIPIVGIILFGLIILKLYLIDVWQMSNVFRIISFIVLGILILITSFMYQKLKNLMKNLIDKPNENTEAEL